MEGRHPGKGGASFSIYHRKMLRGRSALPGIAAAETAQLGRLCRLEEEGLRRPPVRGKWSDDRRVLSKRISYTIEEEFMRLVSILVRLSLGILLALALATQGVAQEKKKAANGDRVSGTIQAMNKDASTFTVRRGSMQRTVVYSADTKFTKVNQPGSIDELKEGVRVICLGKFDEKGRLVATRIDVRLPR